MDNLTNNIPSHWQLKKLGEVGNCVTGNTLPKNDSSNYGDEVPFIKPPQLTDRIVFDAPEKLSLKGSKKSRLVPPNSVLVTCIGNLGRTAINKIPVAFNQQINAIVPNEKLDGRFLFYQAQSPFFKNQLEGLSAATTVAIVNKGKFKTIKVVVPPLPEQHAIVAKIEELLSELENGKQQLLTAQQQLKLYRQSLLKWAFEGKLTNKNVKEGELPQGWKLSSLGDICEMKAGFFVKADNIEKEHKEGLFPCYGGNGLRGYTNSFTHKGNYSLVGRQGALCGNVHRVKGIFHATEHAVVTSPKEGINADWLYYKLTAMKLNQYSAGAAQPGLSVNKLLKIEVSYPTIEEQQLIVSELESKLTVYDKLEETISQSLQQAETLKQSILKKAFEGKLI